MIAELGMESKFGAGIWIDWRGWVMYDGGKIGG